FLVSKETKKDPVISKETKKDPVISKETKKDPVISKETKKDPVISKETKSDNCDYYNNVLVYLQLDLTTEIGLYVIYYCDYVKIKEKYMLTRLATTEELSKVTITILY